MLGKRKSHRVGTNRKALATVAALMSAVFVLALVPAANAQAPVTGYGGQGGVAGTTASDAQSVGGERASGGSGNGNGNGNVAATATESNDLLPFTGTDLLAIFGGGLVLLASGVLLSRVVVRDPA
jgi:hypothetical protein